MRTRAPAFALTILIRLDKDDTTGSFLNRDFSAIAETPHRGFCSSPGGYGMRYLIVPLVGIFLFAIAAGLAGAQGLPSSVGAGLPSLSGLSGSGGCSPVRDPEAGRGLAVNVGYLSTNRSAVFDLTADPAVGNVRQVRHAFPVDGLWLALSANGQVGDKLGIFARGSWLVPSNRPSDRTLLFGTTLEPGTWQTNVQWYNADVAGLYPAYGALTVIGGFRFDSFETKFHDRELVDVDDLATDVTNVTVTSYIPYVGLMVNQGPALKVGLIGFPYVPGNVKYDHTWGTAVIRHEATGTLGSSYFLEAFAEYGQRLMGGYFGIFGIWTYLHGISELDVSRTVGIAVSTSGVYKFTADRQNWILGGKFGLNFTSPI